MKLISTTLTISIILLLQLSITVCIVTLHCIIYTYVTQYVELIKCIKIRNLVNYLTIVVLVLLNVLILYKLNVSILYLMM